MPGHKDWFAKAQSDLKMAHKGLRDDDDTLDCVAYHTHQCAEKVLKGFLIFKGNPLERTHDLEYLLKICCESDADFLALKDDVKKLNPFAIHSRYPDDYFDIDRGEAEDAIETAKRVFDFIQMKMKNSI
ncbi:MAG: HEPN domain-containing protein [Epsilonproteobacteria bacterium]|nr:HEPN domain-containing protein [Campylobacterota bacterium]